MVNRRAFLAGCAGMAYVAWGAERPKSRAAVIGHTGAGNYGHGLDVIFNGRPGIEVVGVADPDRAGRERVARACGGARPYADWREMLKAEKPDLVAIAPRQTMLRREMLLGALGAGAHIACEKPFVQTLADGDAALELAQRTGRRIIVMHQMRLAPAVAHLKRRIDGGLLGDLLAMRAWGKQDSRAGGEDLIVLGTHLFDLMRLFAGDARTCSARVLVRGERATAADARAATEAIGPILGDEIDARFEFGGGVLGDFTSRRRMGEYSGYWGMELIGSRGSARIVADIWPRVFVRKYTRWSDEGRVDQWQRLEDDPAARTGPEGRTTDAANARLVDDWLAAIAEKREAVCGGENGLKAVEMAHAVWRSALAGGPVKLPLAERGHPLAAASL